MLQRLINIASVEYLKIEFLFLVAYATGFSFVELVALPMLLILRFFGRLLLLIVILFPEHDAFVLKFCPNRNIRTAIILAQNYI